MKRIGVFVDVSNLYYTVKTRYQNKVDYSKLLAYISDLGQVRYASAYMASTGHGSEAFVTHLKSAGYRVTAKLPKTYKNSDGTVKRKCDLDVNICMDVVSQTDGLDLIALCTADGDMVPLVNWLIGKNKQVLILGCGISAELAKIARAIELPPSVLEVNV
jgi:uncharacterized LabA/DUF88 family protein